jgi:photosystem II stability/assembly factor-like uncharacterized protein
VQIVKNLLFEDPGGGLEWEQVVSGTPHDLFGVHFANEMTGWAVGENGTILHSEDGGLTWTSQSGGAGSSLADVHFVDPATGWIVGSGGLILKTSNGGDTWTPQASGTSASLMSLDLLDAATGWVVGDEGVILKTTDGGLSWQMQDSGTSALIGSVSFADAQYGITTSPNFGEILYTANGGGTWTPIFTGTGYLLLAVDHGNADTAWAVGMFGAIRKSANSGLSWFGQDCPFPPDWLYDVCAAGADLAWAVGFDGKVIATADGGANWEDQDSGVHAQLEGVHFVSESAGWAVGWDGTIIRRVGSATAVEEISRQAATIGPALAPNYPNPFSPRTTLCYTLPEAEHVCLDVYDVRGAHVRTLVNEAQTAGAHTAVWDGRSQKPSRGQRLIGTIRREGLDHVIVFNEDHLLTCPSHIPPCCLYHAFRELWLFGTDLTRSLP